MVDLDETGEEVFSDRKVNALRKNALIIYVKVPARVPSARCPDSATILTVKSSSPALCYSRRLSDCLGVWLFCCRPRR